MKQNNGIKEELQSMGSPLAELPRDMPYFVPQAYFAQLAAALVDGSQAAAASDPMLQTPAALPFTVPEGYFATLPDTLRHTALAGSVDPGIGVPYKAPDEYFSSLPTTLLDAAKEADIPQRKPKVMSLVAHWRSTMKWAVAAVLVISVGFGGYRYMRPASPDTRVVKQLVNVDGDAIQEYVLNHVDEFDVETLEATVAVHSNVNSTLGALNEEEIREYLNENGWAEKESIN